MSTSEDTTAVSACPARGYGDAPENETYRNLQIFTDSFRFVQIRSDFQLNSETEKVSLMKLKLSDEAKLNHAFRKALLPNPKENQVYKFYFEMNAINFLAEMQDKNIDKETMEDYEELLEEKLRAEI